MRRGVARVVGGLAVAVLVTACAGDPSGDPSATAEDPGTSPVAGAEVDPATATGDAADAGTGRAVGAKARPEAAGPQGGVVVADPEHAVEPPGPRGRDEAIAPPDMLLFNADEPLADEVVAEVAAVEGVDEVSRLSMAQVSLEERVYTVAAVDPATYRLFTPPESALFQEQWDRVAGGEVALTTASEKSLPVDGDGYLQLALGEEDAEEIHVGAIAPQIDQVDAVVNTSWGEELGIPAGNALLVRTGQKAPQALRPEIAKILGDQATIQDMDVVAREGLDTDATQQAFLVGGVAEAVGTFRYTVAGSQVIPEPAWENEYISTEDVPILGSVTCNAAMMPQLRAALEEITLAGLADEINPGEYAGCYYPRFIAGSTTLSNHSFGTALDLNVPGNLRGTVGEMDRGVVAIFKRWGFAWGGDWSYTDPMHFEMASLVEPR